MTAIQKTLKISSVRTVGKMIYLDLISEFPLAKELARVSKLENMMQQLPKTESEKLAREFTKGMVEEIKKSGLSQSLPSSGMLIPLPKSQLLSFPLTVKEYKRIGKPTPLDRIKIIIEVA